MKKKILKVVAVPNVEEHHEELQFLEIILFNRISNDTRLLLGVHLQVNDSTEEAVLSNPSSVQIFKSKSA